MHAHNHTYSLTRKSIQPPSVGAVPTRTHTHTNSMYHWEICSGKQQAPNTHTHKHTAAEIWVNVLTRAMAATPFQRGPFFFTIRPGEACDTLVTVVCKHPNACTPVGASAAKMCRLLFGPDRTIYALSSLSLEGATQKKPIIKNALTSCRACFGVCVCVVASSNIQHPAKVHQNVATCNLLCIPPSPPPPPPIMCARRRHFHSKYRLS